MASTFFGLTIAGSGLTTYNAAINTTANNVSNVRTEGYTRQVLDQKAAEALRANTKFGMIGSGTEATEIRQIRDEYYDTKYWNNNCKAGEYETKYEYLQQIESALQDDDSITGFNTIFSNMSKALEDLSTNPSDPAFRNNFINQSQSLCDYFKQTYNTLSNIQKDANSVINAKVEEINSIANELSLLNRQINTIEVHGHHANELRDQRNMLIDKLSTMVPIEITEQEIVNSNDPSYKTGATAYKVTVMGHTLVDNYAYNSLKCVPRDYSTCQTDPKGLFDVIWENDESILNLGSGAMTGELKALVDIRDGNNSMNFQGEVTEVTEVTDDTGAKKSIVTIKNPNQATIEELTIGGTGRIKLENKYFDYDGFERSVDASGDVYFKFEVTEAIDFPDVYKGTTGAVGDTVDFKGVPYYMQQMNAFIRAYAKELNKIHTGDETVAHTPNDPTDKYPLGEDLNGNQAGLFFTGKDEFTLEEYSFYSMDSSGSQLKIENQPASKKLSSDYTGVVGDSYYDLTAANFKVREDLFKNPNLMATSSERDKGNDFMDILSHMKDLYDKETIYRGASASKFLETLLSDVAIDTNKLKTFSENYSNIIESIKTQRLSVSGVDEDEEAMNLIKFQNAYNLSSRMVQCMSEIYNRLILETGV